MTNEKKVYESAEIKIVSLDRDLLLTSAGSLGENGWASVDFGDL